MIKSQYETCQRGPFSTSLFHGMMYLRSDISRKVYNIYDEYTHKYKYIYMYDIYIYKDIDTDYSQVAKKKLCWATFWDYLPRCQLRKWRKNCNRIMPRDSCDPLAIWPIPAEGLQKKKHRYRQCHGNFREPPQCQPPPPPKKNEPLRRPLGGVP